MLVEPAFLKSVSDYLVYIIIFLGALGGSIKASIEDKDDKPCTRIINILVGFFCGVMVSGHYSDQVSPFLSGIISLTVASVAVVVLESLLNLAPRAFPRLIEYWLNRVIVGKDPQRDYEHIKDKYRSQNANNSE